jgi:hypothetical protein
MGLLDSFMNPQTMGLLGLAQGLGQAAMPSRLPVPMGAAASMGTQGLLGGIGQGMQNAMMMEKFKMLQGLMGGPQSSGIDPNSVTPALQTGADTPSQGTVGAMFSGGTAPAGPGPTKYAESQLAQAPQQGGGYAAGLLSDPSLAPIARRLQASNLLGIPDKQDELILQGAIQAKAPTDTIKTLTAMGVDPNSPQGQAILGFSINKPVNVRGFGYMDATGAHPLPMSNIPGTMPQQMPDGSWGVVPLQGATAAIQGNQAAQTVGSGKGVDAQGNPVPLTTPVGPTAPLTNNNPGALMPGGKLASYPDPQTGLAALDANLQSYGKQGINTLAGVINKWAPPNENNTQAYIADASSRLGIKPDQPIDLSNPVQRHLIGSALMLHENGPSAIFNQPQQPSAVYGAAPLGVPQKAAENAEQNVKIGADQYSSAQKEAQNLGIYKQSLNDMWRLANDPNAKFGPGTPTVARLKAIASNFPGLDMTGAQTSQDVMQKLANFIGMSQLGQGGQTGTDAQLNTILHSVPNGEMTNEAMKQVIPLLISQLDVKQGRANVAANLKKQNNSDFSALPDALSKYNSLADPGTVSTGLMLSQLKGKDLSAYVNGLKQQYGSGFPDIIGRVKQLDQLGAFHQ